MARTVVVIDKATGNIIVGALFEDSSFFPQMSFSSYVIFQGFLHILNHFASKYENELVKPETPIPPVYTKAFEGKEENNGIKS